MRTARTPAEARDIVRERKRSGKSIGFVPTMGALHEGHQSLVRMARENTDFVVSSIFVNPKQFGPREDLAGYPRDEADDSGILERLGCDLLFIPEGREMYTPNDRTRLTVRDLSGTLCGASRPGHFDGVVLVVAKLLNIVQPDVAFFGQKDAQQAVIVQRMVADLDFPVRIRLGPTVREQDGLAMSSRNRYLGGDERSRAPALYRALEAARGAIEGGERAPSVVSSLMKGIMEEAGFEVDYAEAVDGAALGMIDRLEGTVLLAAAGRMGRARLIDNIALVISGNDVRETLLEFPEWSRYAI